MKLNIHSKIKDKLGIFLQNNNVPHLLFYGPPGSGKKSLVYDFINTIYPTQKEYDENVKIINCALGKGIQFIRDEVKQFAKLRAFSTNNFKTILMYNADRLTCDAQSALRRCIELFSESTRFIMIVQNKQKILRPIISRFCDIYVYYPIIDNKSVNLHLYLKTPHFIKNHKLELNAIMNKYYNKDDNKDDNKDMFKITEELYSKGFSTYDIINHYKTSVTIRTYFYNIKEHHKNEKLLMVYILILLFRNNNNFEILALIK